jgi:hypothetical protein
MAFEHTAPDLLERLVRYDEPRLRELASRFAQEPLAAVIRRLRDRTSRLVLAVTGPAALFVVLPGQHQLCNELPLLGRELRIRERRAVGAIA